MNTLAYGRFEQNFSLLWCHNKHDGISNHRPRDCLLNCSFRHISKKTSKLRVTGLCAGNSMTGEFPVQMASNTENISNWWHHHVINYFKLILVIDGLVSLMKFPSYECISLNLTGEKWKSVQVMVGTVRQPDINWTNVDLDLCRNARNELRPGNTGLEIKGIGGAKCSLIDPKCS